MIDEEELPTIVDTQGNVSLPPGRKFTPGELDQIADYLLRQEIKTGRDTLRGKNPILFADHIKSRQRREIQNKNGIPDPAFGSGMYNRSHPRGRKINSPEARKKFGSSFYK